LSNGHVKPQVDRNRTFGVGNQADAWPAEQVAAAKKPLIDLGRGGKQME